MMITCAKCGTRHPLSDEDVAFFYPRFFCLSCGEKLTFNVSEGELRKLQASNDRNRRLADVGGVPPEETVRRVHKQASGGESSGG